MTSFQIIAIILSLAALGSYLNDRYLKFPASIGQMAFALGASASVLFLEALGVVNFRSASSFLYQIDFSNVLLHGMLSFLLFAGALAIEIEELKTVVGSVSTLATVGVIIAIFVTGLLVWYAAALAGVDLPYLYALLFGALVSPTDPIAILTILKEAGLSRTRYVQIGSESLFNDGIGVVAFITILGLATRAYPPTAADVSLLLVREALGGAMLGLLLGWVTYRLLRPIDEYRVEILLTLALAAGGYVLAEWLGVSAPLCIVAAGLLIGNRGRHFGMSARSRRRLDEFWELADEILNAVLFLLIGFEVLVIAFTGQHLILGLFAIAAMLMGRVISVGAVVSLLRLCQPVEAGTIGLLTWGGLRGGLSIAMALSLPPGPEKGVILPVTYLAVMFSILIQGLTFKPALKFLLHQRQQKRTGGGSPPE